MINTGTGMPISHKITYFINLLLRYLQSCRRAQMRNQRRCNVLLASSMDQEAREIADRGSGQQHRGEWLIIDLAGDCVGGGTAGIS
jgi:hypothetical protein